MLATQRMEVATASSHHLTVLKLSRMADLAVGWGPGIEDEDEEGGVTFGWDVADGEGGAAEQEGEGGDDTRQGQVRPCPQPLLPV